VAALARDFPGSVSIYSRPRPPYDIANLGQLDVLPPFLAVFVAVLGLAALSHALVTAVRRRAPHLATLRALGMRPFQVRACIAWQATVVAATGLVLGLPLGLAIGRSSWSLIADRLGVANDALIPVTLAIIVPAALAAANALAWLPGRRAARLRPAQVLRAE